MTPSIGRIVHYRLNEGDVAAIRTMDASFHKNPVEVGQVYPAMIVRVFGETEGSACNLQVFLDGDCSYWAASRIEGDQPFQWSVPPRVG